jgi:hypothetical protein
MNTTESRLELSPDEFAFYFDSKNGVAATELGRFLQRAATVARGQGAELHVIGLRFGSLEVVIKAISKSKFTKNAKKEFEKGPIATSAAGAALVGAVVSAIIFATNSDTPTPLAKSAAHLIEQTSVTQIQIVTVNQKVVIMDIEGAKQIRALEISNEGGHKLLSESRFASLPSPEMRRLSAEMEEGNLTGWIGEFDGELHFRPDGYRYSAPIDLRFAKTKHLSAGRYRVRGDLLLKAGRPDEFVILTAEAE